jgi:hypothetical protein
MKALQTGQWDAGRTTLSLRGRRQMHTLRKLATQAPSAKLKKPNMQKYCKSMLRIQLILES